MKFVLRAFNAEGLSDEDRQHPDVQRELRNRFSRGVGITLAAIPPTTIGGIALLWRYASHRGLLIWGALGVVCLIAHGIAHRRRDDEQGWLARSICVQTISGATWGLLAHLAMPTAPEWQLFVATFLMGVYVANVLFSSHFRATFFAFMAPLAIGSVSAFALNGTGAGRWAAVLMGYGALLSMALSEISRSTDEAASVFAVRSAELAEGLEGERAQLEEANVKLARQASTDGLTQLPNRLEFLRQLNAATSEQPVAPDQTVAVAYLDLDGFKQINDSMGHEVGDQLLIAVGERISSRLTDSEIIARLGGDELVVLSRALPRDGGATELGERLADCFSEPFQLGKRTVACRCSVGIALFDESMTVDELMRFADVALYSAKASGVGGVEFFGRTMHATLQERAAQRDEFTEALRSGQIKPYIQPVVDLRTGAIIGGEALARWEHPDGVRVAASFIELAAEAGKINDLNLQIVEAVSDLGFLLQTATSATLPIGVNVTFEGLEAVVAHFATSDALDAIVIEVEEQDSLSAAEVRDHVERARDMGVKVLLNDFGTGIASLAVAMELPVDGLKVNHQLISELYDNSRGASAAAALIELANGLGLEIVAESIESEEQLDQLRKFGVRAGQGFLFAPAVPMETFHEWVATNKKFPVKSATAVR